MEIFSPAIAATLVCRYSAKKYISVVMITVGIATATLASAHQIVRLTVAHVMVWYYGTLALEWLREEPGGGLRRRSVEICSTSHRYDTLGVVMHLSHTLCRRGCPDHSTFHVCKNGHISGEGLDKCFPSILKCLFPHRKCCTGSMASTPGKPCSTW